MIQPQPQPQYSIPFNRAWIPERSRELAAKAMSDPGGDGPYTRECERWIEQELGVPKVLLTTSGTAALEMAAKLYDRPGMTLPSYGFPSIANITDNTFFVDVDSQTQNAEVQTDVVLHYAGVAAPLNSDNVIEDCAHAFLAKYNGKYLGTFGRLAALSFHNTKNFNMGEGGALIINDPSLIERAYIIRDKGTNRQAMNRGDVDKYTWVGYGSSYSPSDVLAAMLLGQLECADVIQNKRARLWYGYDVELAAWASNFGFVRPCIPPACEQSFHMYYLVAPTPEARTSLIKHLADRGIQAVIHYQPLHRRFGLDDKDFPNTVRAANQLLRLPFYTRMNSIEQISVVNAVKSWRPTCA